MVADVCRTQDRFSRWRRQLYGWPLRYFSASVIQVKEQYRLQQSYMGPCARQWYIARMGGLADCAVQFLDETEDISRIMSAPNMPTTSMTNNHSDSHTDAMDYETIFNSFNQPLPSPFGSTTAHSPFNNNQQTSPFQQHTSPSGSSNLGLERLILSESPTATFNAPPSQGAASPGFGDFDQAMANFNTGIPIESMLDVTSMGEASYFAGPNVVTQQTARLMRHYIDNLASWMDLSDSRNHFSTIVPKRALTSVPILLQKVLT